MKLSVQNGCFSYRAGQPLLENISFEAEGGDVLAILGPNGAGKTTLLKCMLNLLHWREGQTLLDGEDVSTMAARALWQKVAYVPQAKQTLAISARWRKWSCLEEAAASARFQRHRRRISVRRALPSSVSGFRISSAGAAAS